MARPFALVDCISTIQFIISYGLILKPKISLPCNVILFILPPKHILTNTQLISVSSLVRPLKFTIDIQSHFSLIQSIIKLKILGFIMFWTVPKKKSLKYSLMICFHWARIGNSTKVILKHYIA